ncbi:IS3 family transposase [Cytophagaceae bacterium YF14B1]|uniref:IS3 family transposase n=1 Tax=Xanthocytophaga flava TaxID=3048013 RepID=A0AAE3R067_9BACT|nr:IS3 family transposase [Xanthocytophaga flavus]MDJ1486446.1 IS3 family transposase [Xanthocytophaga flavus]
MELWSKEFEVERLCQVLGVSRSGFYRYLKGETYSVSQQKQEQYQQIEDLFWEHKRRYGTRRLQAELMAQGKQIGRHQIRKVLKEKELKAIQPKSFVPKTTQSKHGKRNSPNLLLEQTRAEKSNQIWVSDITYLPLANGGFAYLATWIDLFSRYVVGWQVGKTMEEELVIEALQNGLQTRKPAPGLIVHSDRGGQYVSKKLRVLMKKWKCNQSMSRADQVYDNAFAESFFSRFKTELVENGTFLSVEDAKTECFEYIEIYYNRIRRHSALGYKSPAEFEQLYQINLIHSQVVCPDF